MEIIAENAEQAFHKILDEIEANGFESTPRGMKIKEIINCCVTIKNPRGRIVYCPERKISMSYAFGELCWYLSGRNDLDMMEYYSSYIKKGTDDGKTLNSAYGYRIFTGKHQLIPFNQWENVKRLLLEDKDSRQAIIHLHTPNDRKTNDEVCTLSLQFLIRNGKLDMITTMRSNDIVLGFVYDVFSFTMLQEILANELHVEVGTYYHNVGSMHIYENRFELLKQHTVSNLGYMEKINWNLKDFNKMIEVENDCREKNKNDCRERYKMEKIFNEYFEMDDSLLKFSTAAFLLKKCKNKKEIQSIILNELRKQNENYADVLQFSANFSKEFKKIVVCGIDGAGKSTLAKSLYDFGKYQIQHYSKPTENFKFYENYMYNLKTSINTIFDRFFLSEIVYNKVLRKNKEKRISLLEISNLLNVAKQNNVEFLFIIARNDIQFNAIKMRLEEEDKYLENDLKAMNEEYLRIANVMKENGFDVKILDVNI